MTDDPVLARARRLAAAVGGPGMGTTIRGDDLRGLVALIDRLAAENAALSAGAPLPAPADEWLAELPPIVASLAEVLESHPELWGSSLIDAVEGLAGQRAEPVTDAARAAIERCLAPEPA